MNRKFPIATAGLLALIVVAGLSFTAAASSNSSSLAHAAKQHKPAGLTRQGIKVAQKAGLPGKFVTMAPQSSFDLLARARKIGAHPGDSTIHLTIVLKLRNEAKLKRFLGRVQQPGSPVYHQWLTPAKFTRLYGPTKRDVERITRFLEGRGIGISDVSSNRMLIHTTATTATYEHAFGIRINDYSLHGRNFYSTMDRPKLPRALAPRVASILGLDHGVQLHPISLFQQTAPEARNLGPHQAPSASLTKLSPLQIARAYNYPDITDAGLVQGVHIAIPTANSSGLDTVSDPHDFWAAWGLPDHTINITLVGGDKGKTDGMGETLLDIEYAGAMGPGATLNVYVAADAGFDTFVEVYDRIVNDTNPDGTAKNQVLTTSWGSMETLGISTKLATEQILMQAAAEGLSMFAAAGDHGTSEGTSLNNVAIYPSSSIYMTAANGTQLTISTLAGDYGHEVVWDDAHCFGRGPGATGGAVSRLFVKPDWQVGPGVPTDLYMRMNSDLAATASCSRPLWTLEGGNWKTTAGTSAVAPQFAGMFAIAVAEAGGPLGLSNRLIYEAANNHYGSDFHDITSGCNGKLPDGSPSCAGAAWDHPTGWGSPNVQKLLSHIGIPPPNGTLEGAVHAAASGSAVAGATVVALAEDGNRYVAITKRDGTYSRLLPTGQFSVTVSKFGYDDTTASASIRQDESTALNFSLPNAPKATLSGTVSDGSGHGYGLLASIKISAEGVGHLTDIWTDPADGRYHVELPEGATYTLNVAAAFNGYTTASEMITLRGDVNRDVVLSTTNTCMAPGYEYVTGGFSEDFNGSSFPPPGWTVTNDVAGSPTIWKFNSDWNQDNWTGGTGRAADISSGGTPSYRGGHDSSLITPPIAITALGGATTLTYKANYSVISSTDTLDLDISADGGNSWRNILRWTSDRGGFQQLPGENVRLPLAQYLPATGTFQLRWRKYNSTRTFYAQLDDVAMGHCVPIDGGIVYGTVIDASTQNGVIRATIGDDTGASVKTISGDFDSTLPSGGFYMYFAKAGERTIQATKPLFGEATARVSVANDAVVAQDFTLKSMQFDIEPSSITQHVKANNSATTFFALRNTGAGGGAFKVIAINAPAPNIASSTSGAIVPTVASTPWTNLADYPFEVGDNLVAYDARTGKVYSISGAASLTKKATSYAYAPTTDSWAKIADIPTPRAQTAGAFVDGKLYVVGGNASRETVANLEIYAPATNTWSTGASAPLPFRAASAAALDGKLFVIGGQRPDGQYTSSVSVYDPGQDSWSSVSDYPHPVKSPACGTIDNKIYCAGGFNHAGGSYSDGYMYDPVSAVWSPIADLPVDGGIGGALHGAASGELLLAGGYVGTGKDATRQVTAYDPTTNAWYPLPDTNEPVARGGGSCGSDGFYTVGSYSIHGLDYSDKAQKLPGYVCGTGGIPWLTITPEQGTLTATASTRIALDLDSAGHAPFTRSRAYLKVVGSPNPVIIPITVYWDPQPVNLDVIGNVTPTGVVHKGDALTYNITVQNLADAEGTATRVQLSYAVPQGVTYLASNGAQCAPPPESSAQAVPAGAAGPQTLTCDLDSIAPDTGKLVTIAVQATAAASSVSATFTASAREPQSGSGNTSLTLATDPAVGPPGPKGDAGSAGLGFAGLILLSLLAASAQLARMRRRRERENEGRCCH